MNSQPEGKTKFLFLNFIAVSLVEIARNSEAEILQRNGSETTSTGIAPAGSRESASNFVAGLLKPRFT